jgi:hypothetical protein
MANKLDLLKEARAARNLASRTLRTARRASDDADKVRLRRQAEQLRQRAGDLEQRAGALQEIPMF